MLRDNFSDIKHKKMVDGMASSTMNVSSLRRVVSGVAPVNSQILVYFPGRACKYLRTLYDVPVFYNSLP